MTSAIFTNTSADNATEPQQIAADTWMLRDVVRGEAVTLYHNTMVIAGQQPLLADLGRDDNAGWEDDVSSLVPMADLRWVFVSRLVSGWADRMADLAAASPDATFIVDESVVGRIRDVLPRERIRVVNAGEELDLGDRTLRFVRIPVGFSGSTLGLLDSSAGVLWAGDGFGCALLEPVDEVGELHVSEWREGFQLFNRTLAPWTARVAAPVLAAAVGDLAREDIRLIASAHSPLIGRHEVGSAIDMLYDIALPVVSRFAGRQEVATFVATQYRCTALRARMLVAA